MSSSAFSLTKQEMLLKQTLCCFKTSTFPTLVSLPLGANSDGSCIPFSGTMHGNGFSIKNLVMENVAYPHSALFCSLEDATIQDLVIDESCSFSGARAGGLSVSAAMSLKITNVTNKDDVCGYDRVGGFIAHIDSLEQQRMTVVIEDCVNQGRIVNSGGRVGGFIGYIRNNKLDLSITNSTNDCVINAGTPTGGLIGALVNNDMNVSISDCLNKKEIVGENSVGGIIGLIEGNKHSNITISNTKNNGSVSGFQGVSGFIAKYCRSTNTSLSIVNCENKGDITGSGNYVGCFVAATDTNKQTAMSISKSTNNGNITGKGFVGGFVGYILFGSQHNSILGIIDSENNGNVIQNKCLWLLLCCSK